MPKKTKDDIGEMEGGLLPQHKAMAMGKKKKGAKLPKVPKVSVKKPRKKKV